VNRPKRKVALLPLWLAGLLADSQATPLPFPVCTAFHCATTEQVTLPQDQWRQVDALFQTHTSPEQERAEIRRAIALLERLVGSITGTWRDKAGNFLLSGRQGQLDCIAESRNTTTYLRLIESAGLLRWHSVEERVMRRRWLVSDHWSAVIRDRTSGTRYAVDSWYLDNGEPPYIQLLDDWRSGIHPKADTDRADGILD
jgi:hypothetical protein